MRARLARFTTSLPMMGECRDAIMLPDSNFLATVMVTFWRYLVTLCVAIAAPKSWAAGAATAATAGVAATAAGIDPWPWVIGGFGAAIVFVKRPSLTKADAIINAMISVMIGGIISPWAAAGVAFYVTPNLANSYALAFILSSLWPWLVPIATAKIKAFKLPTVTQESREN